MTIKHEGATFESDGEVVYTIPGAGMGLRFENSENAEQVALNRWLVQISNQVLERVRESTDGKQKILLVLYIVALAAIVGGVLVWAGVLR